MRRFSGLRLNVAYPGTLGITTDKGQQNNYPLVLDAPTESYEIMLLRWQTGVFEVDAPPPEISRFAARVAQYIAAGLDLAQARALVFQEFTGVFDAQQLMLAGFPAPVAYYLEATLPFAEFDVDEAVALGLLEDVADILDATYGGGGLLSPVDGLSLLSPVDNQQLEGSA